MPSDVEFALYLLSLSLALNPSLPVLGQAAAAFALDSTLAKWIHRFGIVCSIAESR